MFTSILSPLKLVSKFLVHCEVRDLFSKCQKTLKLHNFLVFEKYFEKYDFPVSFWHSRINSITFVWERVRENSSRHWSRIRIGGADWTIFLFCWELRGFNTFEN